MNVRDMVQRYSGPFSTVYCCPFCKFHTTVRKGQVGGGRGSGLRNGSVNQAATVAHIKAEHADLLKESA